MIVQVILPPTDSVVDVSREFGGLEGLQIQLSKAVITNCHIGDSGNRSRSNLQPVIRSLGNSCVVWDGKTSVDFLAPHGTAYITKLLQRHADGEDESVAVTAEMLAVHSDQGQPTSLLTDGVTANRFEHSSFMSNLSDVVLYKCPHRHRDHYQRRYHYHSWLWCETSDQEVMRSTPAVSLWCTVKWCKETVDLYSASLGTHLRCATIYHTSVLISASHSIQPGIQWTLQDHEYGLVYHAICLP